MPDTTIDKEDVNRTNKENEAAPDEIAAASQTAPKRASSRSAQSKKKGSSKKKEFAVDELVVYPLQGVGQIIRYEEKLFKEKKLSYYVLFIRNNEMTIMIPVDKAGEMGLRHIIKPKEAEKALKQISEPFKPVTTDWKQRYQLNLDLLKKGLISDITTVVQGLYYRSKVKELPILERKLYDSALTLMIDEISISLQKDKKEIEQIILSRLESDN